MLPCLIEPLQRLVILTVPNAELLWTRWNRKLTLSVVKSGISADVRIKGADRKQGGDSHANYSGY